MKIGRFSIVPLDVLLVFVPVTLGLEFAHAGPVGTFAASALAIVPLAGLMGRATERLAERFGQGLGGLLNATFGNAAELIIAFMALRRGLFDVVKASITGSIIGNILLVLGLAIVVGGVRRPIQTFNRTSATLGTTLLALSAIGLVVPAIFHAVVQGRPDAHEKELSFEIAVVLFAMYLLSLVFTLRTHRHLYASGGGESADGHGGGWSVRTSVVVLVAATVGVAVMSEVLVAAVEPTAQALGMTEVFVGVILVAVIGNAAEHSTAVMVAARDKMDLALNIAVGSSLQIALFVAPVLVFASHALGHPMDLLFTTFEVVAVTIAVGVVCLVAMDGESNWMEGAQLLAVYTILAIAFWFLP